MRQKKPTKRSPREAVVITPPEKLRAISRILRSKKWSAVEFRRGKGKVSVSAEIDSDITRADHWRLHILFVPDLELPEHEHYLFDEREMRRICDFINKLLRKIESLKKPGYKY